MSDNYASPLLNSNNTFHYNYSNSHVINPMYSDKVKIKSQYCCDKSCIGLCGISVFILCVIVLLIIYFS